MKYTIQKESSRDYKYSIWREDLEFVCSCYFIKHAKLVCKALNKLDEST